MSRELAVVLFAALGLALARCERPTDPAPRAQRPAAMGDVAHGKQLVEQMECTRCHALAAIDPLPREKRCTGCHDEILRSTVKGTPEQIARWRTHVAEIADVPSLEGAGSRLRRDWIRSFLLAPHDLRPNLVPSMPRVPLSDKDALDVATYLSPLSEQESDADPLANANVARGRAIVESSGCGACHRFTGASVTLNPILPTSVAVADLPRASRLAPDLRWVRDRFRASALVPWLERPSALKPDALMPSYGMSRDEARDVAAFLVRAPLEPLEPREVPARLPVLKDRTVRYDEVAQKVFKKTCWHCHGEPDFELGDGGPGNSGGFGFKGKGVNLSSYVSTFAGYLDEHNERASLFEKTADGTPYIVAALVARQREEAGETPALRGMPLGLPALSPEEVQLVETWIAQGRLR